MAGDTRGSDNVTESPKGARDEGDGTGPSGSSGWTALSYLISGVAVWGFVGWLVDRWTHTDGIFTAIGIVIGGAGGVYLVARRMGS